ncbi:multicopper oxidase domain-containing protein [Rhodanobacter lindaniclasticus]
MDVHIISSDGHGGDRQRRANTQAWTFGKTVPGPVIHVRQGQTVNITLTNRGTMQHSIDFHSAITPPSLHYVDIMPGESISFSFVAKVPGAFLYHCGTPPVLLHIGNGMYGAIIVSPDTPLPPAAESYVLVQGEWYTRQVSGTLMAGDYEKMQQIRPGRSRVQRRRLPVCRPSAHRQAGRPGAAVCGQRRPRILWSAFHVIGAIFDKVYPGGNPAQAIDGVSTYTVATGRGRGVRPHPGRGGQVNHVRRPRDGARGAGCARHPAGGEPG